MTYLYEANGPRAPQILVVEGRGYGNEQAEGQVYCNLRNTYTNMHLHDRAEVHMAMVISLIREREDEFLDLFKEAMDIYPRARRHILEASLSASDRVAFVRSMRLFDDRGFAHAHVAPGLMRMHEAPDEIQAALAIGADQQFWAIRHMARKAYHDFEYELEILGYRSGWKPRQAVISGCMALNSSRFGHHTHGMRRVLTSAQLAAVVEDERQLTLLLRSGRFAHITDAIEYLCSRTDCTITLSSEQSVILFEEFRK